MFKKLFSYFNAYASYVKNAIFNKTIQKIGLQLGIIIVIIIIFIIYIQKEKKSRLKIEEFKKVSNIVNIYIDVLQEVDLQGK